MSATDIIGLSILGGATLYIILFPFFFFAHAAGNEEDKESETDKLVSKWMDKLF